MVRKVAVFTVLLLACLAIGVWAQSYVFGANKVSDKPFNMTEVSPSQEVKEFFEQRGIDVSYLGKQPGEVPSSVKDSIDSEIEDLSDDDRDDLDALIQENLRQAIAQNDTEYVFMNIGRYRWFIAEKTDDAYAFK